MDVDLFDDMNISKLAQSECAYIYNLSYKGQKELMHELYFKYPLSMFTEKTTFESYTPKRMRFIIECIYKY